MPQPKLLFEGQQGGLPEPQAVRPHTTLRAKATYATVGAHTAAKIYAAARSGQRRCVHLLPLVFVPALPVSPSVCH